MGAISAPPKIAINFHDKQDFYLSGDTISGKVTATNLQKNYFGSKVVVSLECNEICTLSSIGCYAIKHFQRQLTTYIPKRGVFSFQHRSFTVPFSFTLDNEVTGLPPSSSLVSMGLEGTGIWWETRTWLERDEDKSLVIKECFGAEAVEVYPYFIGIKELITDHREGGLVNEDDLMKVILVDMPSWLPQAPQKFNWAVAVETQKPVFVHSITASLLKTVMISVNTRRQTFHRRQELAKIKHGKMLLGRMDLNEVLAGCQIDQREPGGFCTEHQNLYYQLELAVIGMQTLTTQWTINIIPPAIVHQSTRETNQNDDRHQSTGPPAYSRV